MPVLYRSVFECQSDGVIAVDFDGVVMLFNRKAAEILQLDRNQVVGRSFAEVFLLADGLDDLSQAILDAVSERSVEERRVVSVRGGEQTRVLSVTSSYLQDSTGDRAERLGVVAVFSDITELEELRHAEARMAESLRTQNAELQQAYRKVEESNAALESTARKIQFARIAATGFIIALFVAAGAFSWMVQPDHELTAFDVAGANASSSATAQGGEALQTVIVRPEPVASSISLTGRLAPWRKVNVTSPVPGKIAAVHFQYGQAVHEGQRLVELDTAEMERTYRDARREYINALKEFKELQNWENSPEVSEARRSLTRAEVALRRQKSQLDITTVLLTQGIIPANEHEAARQQYSDQKLDLEAARQNLDILLSRNNDDTRQMARLALDNAQGLMRELEARLEGGEIAAPISGIVLDSPRDGAPGAGRSAGKLARGQSVQEGQLLLSIGDLQRLSVVTAVDEVFIPKIRAGQRVRATGDAFPGLVIHGEISHVSSQARTTERSPLPIFEVVGLLQALNPAERSRLRLGMSVDLEVVTYRNPAALMVPLNAIVIRENRPWLRIRQKGRPEIRDIQVKTGVTTIDSVEILQGIAVNDEIVVNRN